MSDAPDPELLARYGTDEIYLHHLEKRAADTIFGAPMASISQSDWARLITGNAEQQSRVDHQRLQAAVINLQLRELEASRMRNVVENLGGPGSMRDQYTRAMQTQPYRVHPLMMAGALRGPDINAHQGLLSPGQVHQSTPVGTGVVREAPVKAPERVMAEGEPDAVMEDLEQEIETTASVKWAKDMGRILAHAEFDKTAQNDTAYQVGGHLGKAVGALGTAGGEAALGTGKALMSAGKGVGGAGRAMSSAMRSFARGASDWSKQDVQPTPRWGAGFQPAADVNQYGQLMY